MLANSSDGSFTAHYQPIFHDVASFFLGQTPLQPKDTKPSQLKEVSYENWKNSKKKYISIYDSQSKTNQVPPTMTFVSGKIPIKLEPLPLTNTSSVERKIKCICLFLFPSKFDFTIKTETWFYEHTVKNGVFTLIGTDLFSIPEAQARGNAKFQLAQMQWR